MEGYDVIDLNLYNISMYVFILVIIIENMYQLVKVFQNREIKKQEIAGNGIIEKPIQRIHAVYLVILGLFISVSFFPYTIFYWLDFGPTMNFTIEGYDVLEVIYNSLFIGLGASTSYNVGERFTTLTLSLIGRVGKKF